MSKFNIQPQVHCLLIQWSLPISFCLLFSFLLFLLFLWHDTGTCSKFRLEVPVGTEPDTCIVPVLLLGPVELMNRPDHPKMRQQESKDYLRDSWLPRKALLIQQRWLACIKSSSGRPFGVVNVICHDEHTHRHGIHLTLSRILINKINSKKS